MKFIMSFLVITFCMVQVSKGVRPTGHSHQYRGSNHGPVQGSAVRCGGDADVDGPQTDGGGENSDYENEGFSQTPETTETGTGKHKSHSRTISSGGRQSIGSGEEICGGHDGPEHLEDHHSHHHHHQHHHHHRHHHHHHPPEESKREVEGDGAENEVRECIEKGCHHHHHHHHHHHRHRHTTSHSGSPVCHESDDEEEEDIRHPLPPTKGLLRKGAFRRK